MTRIDLKYDSCLIFTVMQLRINLNTELIIIWALRSNLHNHCIQNQFEYRMYQILCIQNLCINVQNQMIFCHLAKAQSGYRFQKLGTQNQSESPHLRYSLAQNQSKCTKHLTIWLLRIALVIIQNTQICIVIRLRINLNTEYSHSQSVPVIRIILNKLS